LTVFNAVFLILEDCSILIAWKSLALQYHVNFLFKLIYLSQALQSLVVLISILIFIRCLKHILHHLISGMLIRCDLPSNGSSYCREVLVHLVHIFLLLF